MKSFRDLIAYTRARRLARLVYDFTKAFPKDEQYALTSQIRRAVYSVSLNIAEGYGIGTPQATLRYLRIARGSLCEVRAGIDLAEDLGYAYPNDELANLLHETARVLQGLIVSMERKIAQPPPPTRNSLFFPPVLFFSSLFSFALPPCSNASS